MSGLSKKEEDFREMSQLTIFLMGWKINGSPWKRGWQWISVALLNDVERDLKMIENKTRAWEILSKEGRLM